MMKRTGIAFAALCAVVLCGCITNQNQIGVNTGDGNQQQTQTSEGPKTDVGVNLNFRGGWTAWGGLQASPDGNTVTFNGKVERTAGYVSANLDKFMANKTVTLKIRNAEDSVYDDHRMLKITVNDDDQLIHPINVPELMYGEYIPPEHKTVKFLLPVDFDGKLGFVFYQADLRNFQITATYK